MAGLQPHRTNAPDRQEAGSILRNGLGSPHPAGGAFVAHGRFAQAPRDEGVVAGVGLAACDAGELFKIYGVANRLHQVHLAREMAQNGAVPATGDAAIVPL